MKLVKYAIIVLALILQFSAIAQENTPQKKKSPTVKGINLSLGYSYGGITSNTSFSDNVFASKLMNGSNTMSSEYSNEIFNISFDLGLEFSKTIEVDFLFSYNHNHGMFKSDGVASSKLPYTEDWFTLMPGVKFNWLHKHIGHKNGLIKLYSKANIGFSLANRYEVLRGGPEINAKGAFAFQAIPIGFEIGGKLCRFFLEGGYGYTGYVRGGVKFSFGHSSSTEVY